MQLHSEGAVRHAEKRRRGTCEFANRIARIALKKYHDTVPKSYRDVHKQTCVAAIVACFRDTHVAGETYSNVPDEPASNPINNGDHFQVMGLGVGTKFLSAATLREEPNNCTRVRDCHAEVLARRAFRRQLLFEIENEGRGTDYVEGYVPILERIEKNEHQQTHSEAKRLKSSVNELTDSVKVRRPRYRLKPGVTIHFYASSAPCGNATLKKFVKMEKETFDSSLLPNQWPQQPHNPLAAHSLRLGQFALLVKKDSSMQVSSDNAVNEDVHESETNFDSTVEKVHPPTQQSDTSNKTKVKPKAKSWPYRQDDSWCPPSCSITNYNKGSIHSCSDKLCRWNCLGLQGSLLMALLQEPLYMTTLTVGRKFSRAICQRAVCCRADGFKTIDDSKYMLNHPVLMETNVYMDETGTHSMEGVKVIGQDASFDSSNLCWAWWPAKSSAECIDGKSGLLVCHDDPSAVPEVSLLSNQSYTSSVLSVLRHDDPYLPSSIVDLKVVASLKHQHSPEYHAAKADLLKHRVFREWSCRFRN